MAAAKKGTTQKLVDAVIAQRDGKPLTLATTRIVYALTLGDDEQAVTERVIDGDMVARLLEVAGDPEHLFDPEHIALQVKTVADLLGRIADHSDDDGPLYFLEETLVAIARRLSAMRSNVAGLGQHYRIEPTEASR